MEMESHDLISNLPLEVLQQIVSFVPLKEAIRTSTLSTLWRSLWIPIQVDLDFDGEKLIQVMIDTFLKSCDNTPQLWKFNLLSREKVGPKIKNNLFFLAAKGVEKELHLDFCRGKDQITSNFSLMLDTTSCLCPSKQLNEKNSFASLKTLHLRSVNYLVQGLVSSLFSHFKLLQSLKLEKCHGLQRIDVKASDSLQSFVMVDCQEIESITLFAPNLQTFSYRGALPLVQLKSSPNLVDVVLDLREGLGRYEFDCEDVLSLLACLQDIEALTISSWLLEWMCKAGVIFPRLQFQFNKLKELCYICPLIDQPKRDSLACFLNILPFLERLFVNIDQSSSLIPTPFFHQFWHEPHLWMDYATVKFNALQLNHLKVVKLVGFIEKEDELMLMDLLFKKSITMKSMIVTTPKNQSWSVTKIPCSQLKQTSGCYPKQIVISFLNKDYFFGLTEVENDVLCLANACCL